MPLPRYVSPLLIALAIVAVLAGSVYLYLRIFRSVPELPEPHMPTVSPPPRETPPPPPPPPLVLPALDESDTFIRPLVEELSSRPELVGWLVNENLVRRFVTAVDNVARGESPRVHVPFLEPGSGFSVEEERNGRTVIAERSFERYDAVAAVVGSLDTAGTVRLFRDLEPLFEEAYDELGNPDTFEEALTKAIDRMLAVNVPDEIAVTRGIKSYRFADRRLERLSPAAKHLLRMGPDNAREIQAKLRELKRALELTRDEGSPAEAPSNER